MTAWNAVITDGIAILTGAGGVEIARWLHGRGRTGAENKRDEAMAESVLSQAALSLLEPYRQEVEDLTGRIEAMETTVAASKTAQTRLERLLTEAVRVLKVFLSAARDDGSPIPKISDELLAEIEGAL